jgi:transcriptional regulator with XRE-family HTH domain
LGVSEGSLPGDSERNVAEHVRRERERRGWSTAELARHVTRTGVSMSQSAIWRIENGEPRRKITVDELIAFTKVFDKTIDDLLQPVSDEYPEPVVEAYAQAWVIAEDGALQARITARTAFADFAAVVAAYPGALPHLPKMLDKIIERSDAGHIRNEVDEQLPEVSRYLATKGPHQSLMDNGRPLVEYWQSLGMTHEEMLAEAERGGLSVPFYSATGRLNAVYDSDGSVGEKLQLARKITGRTIDQLSTATRIRAEVIRALERDEYSALGESAQQDVYARGHIRVLSRHLGLDAAPLLQQYDAEHSVRASQSEEDPSVQGEEERPRKRIVVRRKKSQSD